MTSDLELGVPEVSLVSGLERFGGVLTQEVIGALWEGRKLVGWEQFWKRNPKTLSGAADDDAVVLQMFAAAHHERQGLPLLFDPLDGVPHLQEERKLHLQQTSVTCCGGRRLLTSLL